MYIRANQMINRTHQFIGCQIDSAKLLFNWPNKSLRKRKCTRDGWLARFECAARLDLPCKLFIHDFEMQHALASRTCFIVERICATAAFQSNFFEQFQYDALFSIFFRCWLTLYCLRFVAFTVKCILPKPIGIFFISSAASIRWFAIFHDRSQKRECKCAKKQHESFAINIHGSISPRNIFTIRFLSIDQIKPLFSLRLTKLAVEHGQ